MPSEGLLWKHRYTNCIRL